MTLPFTGTYVALATPFETDGSVDFSAFRRLVRHVVGGGVDGLVVLGSTGEAATIDLVERRALVLACREEARGHPAGAGPGHNDPRQAAAVTRMALELGANGALVVTPYYTTPAPTGLVAHYEAVAAAAPGLPIIAYNVPDRTGLNLSPATLNRLWENPQVVALKESSGNLRQFEDMLRTLPEGKAILCGDDDITLPAIAAGAVGLVSVMGNLVPRETRALVDAALAGNLPGARSLQNRLLPLIEALFLESNPIPLKAGLAHLGLAQDVLRLPLTSGSEATRARMAQALAGLAEPAAVTA